MSTLKLAVIGAGKRVQSDVLPVLATLSEQVELVAVGARSTRTVDFAGRPLPITALDELIADGTLAACDVVYVVVAKGSVPAVVARLAAGGVTAPTLLLETPGLLLKHLGHLGKLAPFERVAMAEDCSRLPWLDVVSAAEADGTLGPLQHVLLDRSAWRYHGMALMKALFGRASVRWARRVGRGDGARVEVHYSGGRSGVMVETRDYDAGHLVLTGAHGVVSDAPELVPDATALQLVPGDWESLELHLGDHVSVLPAEEAGLLSGFQSGDRVTAHTHGMKRIGLRRLLLTLAAGGDAWPLSEGLDDMLVDALLEKARVYLGTPATAMTSPLGRALVSTLMRPLAR